MNELLLWMSARHSGSALSFRSKCAEIGSLTGRSPHRIAQWNLSKLAHAEFAPSAGDEGWCVAPPILAAGDPYRSCRAVLCGARTPLLLSRLHQVANSFFVLRPQPGGPDIVEINAPNYEQFETIAAKAGIGIQWNASLALLACCRAPASEVLAPAEIPIGGWEVMRFSKTGRLWVTSSVEAASKARGGFFRFRSEYSTLHILIEKSAAFSVDPAIGKYRLLRRQYSAIRYESDHLIRIRASCRPPALVERALVLSSGELPVFANGYLTYSGVDPLVASALAALLEQRLW